MLVGLILSKNCKEESVPASTKVSGSFLETRGL